MAKGVSYADLAVGGAALSLKMYLDELPLVPVDVLQRKLVLGPGIMPVVPPSFDLAVGLEEGTVVYAFAESLDEPGHLEVRGLRRDRSTYLIVTASPEAWEAYEALRHRYPVLAEVQTVVRVPLVTVVDRRNRRVWIMTRRFLNQHRCTLDTELDRMADFYAQLA